MSCRPKIPDRPFPALHCQAAVVALAAVAVCSGLVSCAFSRTTQTTETLETGTDAPEQQLLRAYAQELASPVNRSDDEVAPPPPPPGVDPEALLPASSPTATLSLDEALRRVLAEVGASAEPQEPALEPEAVDAERQREALHHYIAGRTAALDNRQLIAVNELREALRLDPASTPIMRELARSYLILGSVPQAVVLFQQVLFLEPEDSEALLTIALTAADRRDFEQVVATLGPRWLQGRRFGQRFEHDEAADIVASAALATALRRLGYDRASISVALETVDVMPQLTGGTLYGPRLAVIYRQRGDTWRSIGDAFCRIGDCQSALDAYEQAALLPTPDPGALHPRIVYANLALGRLAGAQLELLGALKSEDRRLGDREVQLCQYLASHAQPVESLATAVRSLYAEDPDEPDLARAAAALLPSAESQALLLDFLRRQPRDVAVVTQLLSWLIQDDPEAAVALCLELVNENPDLADVYVRHLMILSLTPTEVISAVRQLPATAGRENLIARLLASVEAIGQAWNVCQEALRQWPQESQLLLLQVELAAELGESKLLKDALEQAAMVPGAWAQIVTAQAWRRMEEPALALEAAERAVAMDPQNVDARLEVARAQVMLASAATDEADVARWAGQATAAAEEILAIEPTNDEAHVIFVELFREGGPLADPARLRQTARRLFEANRESRLYATLAARESVEQGMFEPALDRLLALYASDPGDPGSLVLAVSIWARLQRLGDAERWLNEQRESRPGDIALLEQWAAIQLQEDRQEQALAAVRQRCKEDPENLIALRLLENCLAAMDRTEESVAVSEERLLSRPIGGRRELGLAAVYAQARMVDKATEHLAWILEHADEQNFNGLLSALTLASSLDRQNPRAQQLVLDFAREAIERYPETPLRVYGAALVALANQGPLDERFDDIARRGLQAPRAGEPSMLAALQWRRIAQDLVDEGHFDAAARLMRARLLDVAPLDADARAQLTLVALAAGSAAGDHAEHTISLLRELDVRHQLPPFTGTEEAPDLVEALFQASTIYSIVGDEEGADRLLREVIALDGDHAMAMNNLGYLRLQKDASGEDPQVEAWILRAYELQPEDSNILDTLGWLRYKQGRLGNSTPPAQGGAESTTGAIELIRRAIDAEESPSGEVFDHLGDAYYRNGEVEPAREAWERAAAALDDPEQQQQIMRNLMLIQTRLWRLVVADPRSLYHRDYGQVLERTRSKLQALSEGAQPRVAPTFAEHDRPGE